MDRRVVKRILPYLSLVLLSLVISYILFYVLSFIWTALFPITLQYLKYTSPLETPVHWVTPPAVALMSFLLLELLKGSRFDPKSVKTLIGMIIIVFLAYYIGLAGFNFFTFTSLPYILLVFSYFLYVPYWGALGGVIAAWLVSRFLK